MYPVTSSRGLRFLGSMPLAVTLLAAVAIASVIGTLLQQNQPYQDYIIKFGPFWHQVYQHLGLYDVYSSLWFLILLAFLIVSTSLCLIQNGPGILRSSRDFRENMHAKVLAHMPHTWEWYRHGPAGPLTGQVRELLESHGYRLRVTSSAERTLLAAKKGSANSLGYICTHLAVVVICIGGLLDGNIPMKLQSLSGALQIETRDLPASQIPLESQLGPGNASFRASISIPEGATADFAFINLGPGYVLQQLPFQVRLKDFRIEHYSTGQPKSFESDIVLHDPATDKTMEQTISVNHPLRYQGFNIYQASFEDGGSKLDLKLHPLGRQSREELAITARVNETVKVTTPKETLQLELDDFRLHNISQQAATVERRKSFRDNGPSVNFKLRRPDGTAREYINYMLPVTVDGRDYLLSGMRASQAEEFRYLYIPADESGGPGQFLQLVHLLHDEERLEEIITSSAEGTAARLQDPATGIGEQISQAMLQVLRLFRNGGYSAIASHIENTVPEGQREMAGQAYIRLLHNALQTIFMHTLGGNADNGLSQEQTLFLEDAIQALAGIANYGAPFYIELADYEHRQASGLMITRSPGKLLVYPGFVLLLAGIYMLFYIAQRRIWLELTPTDDGRTRVLMAGETSRMHGEFEAEFERIAERARHIADSNG